MYQGVRGYKRFIEDYSVRQGVVGNRVVRVSGVGGYKRFI